MKRRDFLKGITATGLASLVPASWLSSCASEPDAPAWDFDRVMDRSGTWSIKYGRATNGEIPMWIADMDFGTDPYVKEALLQRISRDGIGYTSTPDLFYEAIGSWEEKQHGFSVEREWIGFCPGVITSMNQAYLTFTEPGDKIIVQPPVYDHFRLYIERLGRVAVDNPLIFRNGRYSMDFEGLEGLMDERTKMLVLCNPQNPCGTLWDKESMVRLAEVCERHGVIVISDEIHGDLSLYGRRLVPFCSVSEAAARIGMIFTGPTKAFNLAGLSNTAYCIIPDKEKRERYLATLSRAKLNEASIPTLVAVTSAYREDTTWLEALKRYIEGNVERVMEFFAEHELGMVPLRPEASFLVWIDCRKLGLTQDVLLERFNKGAKIIPSNGSSYGTGGEGFIRLNIGCPRSVLEEALERIRKEFS